MHAPIQLFDISFSLPHKTCFNDFKATVNYGDRIAIIGCNGCGKSTLVQILQTIKEPTYGRVNVPNDVVFGYVPQLVDDNTHLSGGQRFNKRLKEALQNNPNILVLDEPSNHLDIKNRELLTQQLYCFVGTLIIISHDTWLLNNHVDKLWHIDNGKIHIFSGNYDDYIRQNQTKLTTINKQLAHLDKQKNAVHHALMKEQKRASKSRSGGRKKIDQRKWPTIVSKAKANQAAITYGKNKSQIKQKREHLQEQIDDLYLPEVIMPKFSLKSEEIKSQTLISISNGSIGYKGQDPLITQITLSITGQDRIAIKGDNGSGKSSLIKAFMDSSKVERTGHWHIPKNCDIGYLDQHYITLDPDKRAFDNVAYLNEEWDDHQVRKHLNDFLFRKNEEVNILVKNMSGGEKVRLCLAQIGIKTPKILILDEITNNLDLETKNHVTGILKSYPGAIIIISHDEDFLQNIYVKDHYIIKNKSICSVE